MVNLYTSQDIFFRRFYGHVVQHVGAVILHMGLFGYQLLSGIVHMIIITPCHITTKKVY